jgi:hypothetical protein
MGRAKISEKVSKRGISSIFAGLVAACREVRKRPVVELFIYSSSSSELYQQRALPSKIIFSEEARINFYLNIPPKYFGMLACVDVLAHRIILIFYFCLHR